MVVSSIGQVIRIANVQPQVNGGSYPAKASVGEPVIFSADIFTYGQEELVASVCLKPKSGRRWDEIFLHPVGNDRWEYTYDPEVTGMHHYKVQAWIDHFATWKKGMFKKHSAGQPIEVELAAGAELIQKKLSQFKSREQKILVEAAQSFLQKDFAERVTEYNFKPLDELMLRCRDHLASYPLILEFEVERKLASYSTWYELFPRSASPEPGQHGTFKDVINLLPRISGMGFDVLYLPPIHPIGTKHRKGKNNSLVATEDDPGSPWAIGNKDGGHKAIHKQLGTLRDFKKLISEASKKGINIAMDIAFQCSPDHPYITQHPEWFTWRPDGTIQYAENPPKRYEDIVPFNFETDDQEALWEELSSVFEYWIDQGIRVFRVDNPHTKAFAFWEWAIPRIRSQHDDVIFLAEAFTRPRIMELLGMAGFTQSYTYYSWRHSKAELEQYMRDLLELRYTLRPNFWPNTPDILTPELANGGENMHIIRLILAGTLSSSYGVYGPVYEFGIADQVPGKDEYNDNEKYEIKHWDWNRDTRIKEVMSLLNRIRRENPALQVTWNFTFCHSSDERIICFMKHDVKTGNRLLIAVNLDPWNAQSSMVNIPQFEGKDETFRVKDLLSLDTYEWRTGQNYVRLDPWAMPAHILRVEQPHAKHNK